MRPRHLLIALLPLTVLLTACRTGQVMWGPCSPGADPWGTDGTYVLLCRDGEWQPTMTVNEYVALRRGEHPVLAPLPTRPSPTTSPTTTSPTTTSPTTTAAPATTTTVAPTTTTTTSTTTPTTAVPDDDTAPSISGFDPDSGPVAGGQSVTILGVGFTGTTSVTFGGVAASFTVDRDDSLTVVTPAHAAGAVDVVVTDSLGSDTVTDGFEFLAIPQVTGVAPAIGPASGGTTVTITGSGLAHVGSVDFGEHAATSFVVDSDTQITAVTPAATPGSVSVRVTSWGGTSDATIVGEFTYIAGP